MAQTSARIVKTEGVIGGKPRIDGTRLSVFFVRQKVEGADMDPETFAAKFDVDVADVYRALAYFHDHPEEMAEIERRRKDALEMANGHPHVGTGPNDLGEPTSE